MKKATAGVERERFKSGAEKYAAYLETPEGRLRLDLALANLKEFLPRSRRSLRALDVGGGTGAAAVRLAELRVDVTLLDSSLPMLDIAARAARDAGLSERIALKQGDAARLAGLFTPESFDVIVCHNILEYVEDPSAVLRGAARVMRGPSAILSVLVRSRAGEVLKNAIQGGDVAAAEHALTAEWGQEALYGGRVRLFTPDVLHTMMNAASLAMIAERGVRVLADYFPPQASRTAEYDRIFDLERKLGIRPEFAAVARYFHCLARRVQPTTEEA